MKLAATITAIFVSQLLVWTAHADTRIDEIPLTGLGTGWGSAQHDHSIEGKPLTVAGETFAQGIGVHANGSWSLALDGKAKQFKCKVGIDDETQRKGSAELLVFGNGYKLLARSGIVRGGDKAKELIADLSGQSRVVLVFSDAGDGAEFDHLDLLEPVIVGDSAVPTPAAAGVLPAAVKISLAASAAPDLSAKRADLSLTSPLDYQVIQRRSVREGVLPVAGHCEIANDQVEVRVTGKNMDGASHETKWIAVPRDRVTGDFKTEIVTPAGGWYAVEVRAKQAATLRIEHVGIGEVFVGAGQSNSTSCGGLGSQSPLDGRTQPQSGLVTTFNGSEWRIANDPQPGSHDEAIYASGSFWPAFGDAMAAKYRVPIGVAVTGHGGTSINAWKKGGELFNWSLGRMRELGPKGFRAVLWHQGESDADMPARQYADGLSQIIHDFRQEAGWEMPWFVAHASFVPGKPTLDTGSRGGQKMLWDEKVAFEGPDTDPMLGDLRDQGGKGIHFSKKGLNVHGEAWAEKVAAWLDHQLE
jgi:hypothetical protein